MLGSNSVGCVVIKEVCCLCSVCSRGPLEGAPSVLSGPLPGIPTQQVTHPEDTMTP